MRLARLSFKVLRLACWTFIARIHLINTTATVFIATHIFPP
ncbi:hypothetical protein 1013_scaffold3125_00023 [Bacteriophage sp.]|nr:hypothetical protein 1013_scaffold3125_00023 [Bacteriophage sp.]